MFDLECFGIAVLGRTESFLSYYDGDMGVGT